MARPKYIATLLRDAKIQHETPHKSLAPEDMDHGVSHEKFDILVETLGEVIKDYMDKDKSKDTDR